jgi:hypothetical protein
MTAIELLAQIRDQEAKRLEYQVVILGQLMNQRQGRLGSAVDARLLHGHDGRVLSVGRGGRKARRKERIKEGSNQVRQVRLTQLHQIRQAPDRVGATPWVSEQEGATAPGPVGYNE